MECSVGHAPDPLDPGFYVCNSIDHERWEALRSALFNESQNLHRTTGGLMEACAKTHDGRICGSYAINEHRGSGRCDRCWQEDRAEKAEARVAKLEAAIQAHKDRLR